MGVLGGTFDPIHHGHLAAASEVCARLGLDQILLTPAYSQPFKQGIDAASPAHRLAMCELAAAEDERFAVSPVDIERGGVTYTVDTLVDLREQRPDAELFFITGADALARLDEWRDADRLPGLANFVGVTRPGHSLEESEWPHILVETPSLAISSTDVRRRVRAGLPIRYLVPRSVADYIAMNGLYYGGLDD
ncbi:nicotinate-nucleotide adenylyltransferase [Demequina sp. SYSU T00192]|uniref:Probable nicotinate-nucleotide adenylyltransferase n=1 Tax=Demequina litoralis TaxID=3051660 RepID=A0ABT8GDH2_9MICO|nr:nicotinate-nucleotide adenylyltransferase [Demequina sp. SYSU T00192]MDN4476719.1 nicotinate-nucleotide adenylyltransferase [Demequina sp. SYSU T00192]